MKSDYILHIAKMVSFIRLSPIAFVLIVVAFALLIASLLVKGL